MCIGGRDKKLKGPYSMGNQKLEFCDLERYLGVIMSADLKVGSRCYQACLKANRMLGLIKRSFITKSSEVLLNLYKSIVRPHLEFCVSAYGHQIIKKQETSRKGAAQVHEDDSWSSILAIRRQAKAVRILDIRRTSKPCRPD